MAKVRELDEKAWKEWLASRQPVIRELCERLPPDRLYRMKPNGQRVTLYAYNEDGTVTVQISGQYNVVIFDRHVFGVNPDDLEECELPSEAAPHGTMLTEESEINEFVRVSPRAFVVFKNLS